MMQADGSRFENVPFDEERNRREYYARKNMINELKQDWELLTGENMDSENLDRLRMDWWIVHGTPMSHCLIKNFRQLMNSWALLTTGPSTPSELKKLTEYMTEEDFESLKKDYLVLNWMKMSATDSELLKENWSKIAQSKGVDTGEEDIKRWLLQYEPLMERDEMSQKERIEYTRRCLERGADVNALTQDGYSLLHMILSNKRIINAPLIEVLLSFGADVTLRKPITKETPLEIIRTYYYKDHEDTVSLLKTAVKSARSHALFNRAADNQMIQNYDLQDASLEFRFNKDKRDLDEYMTRREDGDKKEMWWVERSQPPYLRQLSELFDYVELKDIDSLVLRVINFMYISRIHSTKLKFRHHADITDKFVKMHQVFSRMCSKLFNLFDPQFGRPVNVEFDLFTALSRSADLVFLLEIDPEVEWVSLKMYAVPWHIEYYVYCKTSSISRFRLGQNLQSDFPFSFVDLMRDYAGYLGEYQNGLRARSPHKLSHIYSFLDEYVLF